ncbi:MAG: hypothetical protein E7478_05605 [Ruminococcaceae bacterium]|nr:hypothetical protein [Oscillospiraceae bacterium]
MREKAAKIIFVLMLVVPISIVLFSAFCGLIFGATGLFGSELSGWDAFYSNLFWTVFALVIIPVIPLCLAYDIAYLVRRFVRPVREMPLSRYVTIVIIVVAVIAGVVLLIVFSDNIEGMVDSYKAKSMWKKADEIVVYDTGTYSADGILGIAECKSDSVLIDHDDMKLGIIYNASFDEYREYKLVRADGYSAEVSRIKEQYFVNAVIPLSSPCKRLICFYPEDESNAHRTIAFILETEDGVYYADDLLNDGGTGTEYFGFRGCKYYVSGAMKYDALPQ